ncbi:MAG: threonine--tRNA ligase [Oscillospiraceae bacterium]|jgi:threonyl-tRNA synthetase|nr:threonine--tRNA ligase [Oscillospiraceae bacterium]
MISVKLKDGSKIELENGASAYEAAEKISGGLARAALCAEINGETRDLRDELRDGDGLNILTFESDAGKAALRHTASHIMAQAVKRLYPEAKLAIGPAIENGFYYDFDVETPFTQEDLDSIEAEMKKIIKEKLEIERFELPRGEAVALMEKRGEPYKIELIRDLPEDAALTFYRQGEFTDLCAGPHVMDTGRLKAYKLTSATGAYWRGDSSRKMLCRIYGTAFMKNEELAEYLERIEEAKRRDHRRLGKELGLFALMDEGPGFPFFLPNGMILKNKLIDYWREIHTREGYHEISTPIMLTRKLWEESGHWAHYSKNMYTSVIDEEEFAIKPMNCPGGILVYKTELRSYRDLPLKIGELGLVHRHELSGALHGMMRVRCFTQDDAHIFMTKEQIKDEIKNVIRLIDEVYSLFGFTYHVELSTMPEDHMGDEKDWEDATEQLRLALKESGKDFVINEGDGAFYGPKIDFHLEDSMGRTWQCGTIQLDFQLPERFELEYVGADGGKHRPVMVHRVVFGAIERFIAILIEHCAGAFPTWLAPVQVKVIPITDRTADYADGVKKKLRDLGIRAECDHRSEKMGYKIREAQLRKIPYMLVVGDQEAASGEVSVRSRAEGDVGVKPLEAFTAGVLEEISSRKSR